MNRTTIHGLTVLGSGTIIPSANHGCAGYVVDTGRGPLLLDCGPGTLCRLAGIGRSAADLGLVLITHFHLDHVSDLAALLQSRWLIEGGGRLEATLIGPRGLQAHLDWLRAGMDSWFADFDFRIVELAAGQVDAGGLSIVTLPTGHTAESICYRLEGADGVSVFYSGDTDYNEELIRAARQADIGIFECSMPDHLKQEGHLTPRLAARLAAKAGVRRLVLTHLYPQVLETDIPAEVAGEYGGPLSVAEDGASYLLAEPVRGRPGG